MQHIHPSDIEAILTSEQAMLLSPAARERLGWIAYVVRNQCSISDACTHLGISRSSLHRWLERFDPTDLSSLEEKSHDPHSTRSSNVPLHIVALIRAYREREPLMGKERIRELLRAEHDVDLSSSTIGRVIERECLYFAQTPLHWRKRMRNGQQMQPVQTSIAQVSQSMPNVEHTVPATKETRTDDVPAPVMTTIPNPNPHDCLMCRLKRMDKSPWKRALILTSILTNVAIAALFVMTTLWEAKNPPPLPAQTSTPHTITETVSTLDN
ncbi:MAG TPA: helix-turn-helix domain-containing protein [Candidatus Peribacteraceae bacterium]|nr:helix-turn-helix domain-containing protein [Candidatus Peribacteraceae bacterium]